MQFLTSIDAASWCRGYGHPMPSRPSSFSKEAHQWRHDFRIPTDAGRRVALCRVLWNQETESIDEKRLLLITDWGVWASGEHPPLFATLRLAFGETRPLIEAPAQLFDESESDAGLSFLIVCAIFLWDCWMLGSGGSIVFLSHDEYGFVVGPVERDSSHLLSALNKLQVLS
jgi:hypothetical protein